MNPFIKYTWIFVIVVFLFSCEKEIDLNITGQPKLVVNGLFSPDSLWSVHVSRSVPVLSKEPPLPVNNATLQIFENGILLEELTTGENGLYQSTSHKPVMGKTYELYVKAEELGQAEASEVMNVEKVSILSASYLHIRDAENGYPVNIKFKDPEGIKNHYIAKVYAVENNGMVHSTDIGSDDVSASSNKIARVGIGFTDELFDGKEYTFQMRIFLPYPKIIIELQNVSQAYYQYHYSHHLQLATPTDPFTTPTEIYNNIKNGLGIFAAYQADTMGIQPMP